MPLRKQSGFTLIELMIVIAIVAILLNIALPAYLTYTNRVKVGGGLALASAMKIAVSEHYYSTGSFPSSNGTAGASEPGTITSEHVNSVGIEVDPISGVIKINYKDFGPIMDGNTLMLIPADCGGLIRWTCTTDDINDSYVPVTCRGSFNEADPCAIATSPGMGTGDCAIDGNCSGGGDGTNPGGAGSGDGTNNPGYGNGNN